MGASVTGTRGFLSSMGVSCVECYDELRSYAAFVALSPSRGCRSPSSARCPARRPRRGEGCGGPAGANHLRLSTVLPSAGYDVVPNTSAISSVQVVQWDLLNEAGLEQTVRLCLEKGRSLAMTTRTLNGILHAIAKARDAELAERLFQRFEQCGVERDEATFSILITMYGRRSEPDKAKEVFGRMGRNGYPKPNAFCYSALLDALGRAHRTEEARNLFIEMVSQAEVGTVAVNTFLKVLAKADSIDEAFDVLSLMKDRGLVPDNHTLCTMLHACSRARKLDLALRLVQEASESSLRINRVSVAALIDVCSKCGEPERGQEVFDIHLGSSNPSTSEFNCLIDGYCRVFQSEKGFAVFERMRLSGVSPDRITFNILLLGFSRTHDFKRAGLILDIMTKEYRYKPDQHTFNALLNACVKSSRIEVAFQLFDKMISAGVSPNQMTFNMLVDVCGRSHALTRAEEVMVLMVEHGFEPDRYTFNTLITASGRCQDVEGAYHYFREMQAHGIEPDNLTFNSLLRAVCLAGQVDKIGPILRDMDVHGLKCDRVAYNTVALGFARKADLSGVLKACEKLGELGLHRDAFMYGALIEASIRAHLPETALSYFIEMHHAGHILSHDLHAWLIGYLFNRGMLDAALVAFHGSSNEVTRRLNSRHLRILQERQESQRSR